MTTYDYIAARKPSESLELIKSYGFSPVANTLKCLSDCLAKLSVQEGTPFLDQLAAIHPDKDLILSVEASHSFDGATSVMSQSAPVPTSSPCGCGNKCKGSGGCGSSQQNHFLSSAVLVVGLLLSAAIISKM